MNALPSNRTASQVLAQLCEDTAGRVSDLEDSRRWAMSVCADVPDVDEALAVARRHHAGLEALLQHKTLLCEEQFDVFADVTHKPWMVIKELPSTSDSVQLSVTAYVGSAGSFVPHGKRVDDAFWVLLHERHYQLVLPLSDVALGAVAGAEIQGEVGQNDYVLVTEHRSPWTGVAASCPRWMSWIMMERKWKRDWIDVCAGERQSRLTSIFQQQVERSHLQQQKGEAALARAVDVGDRQSGTSPGESENVEG